MDEIIVMENDEWTGRIILREDGFFEGVAFNEKCDIPVDLINGFHNKALGEMKFELTKSKHSYTLYDENLHDNYYVMLKNIWRDSKSFRGVYFDEFNASFKTTITMHKHEIIDREFDKEMDDIKLLINNTKSEIFGKTKKHVIK